MMTCGSCGKLVEVVELELIGWQYPGDGRTLCGECAERGAKPAEATYSPAFSPPDAKTVAPAVAPCHAGG